MQTLALKIDGKNKLLRNLQHPGIRARNPDTYGYPHFTIRVLELDEPSTPDPVLNPANTSWTQVPRVGIPLPVYV
ncbi:hypothetical protein KPH14_010996 [Odynerus spinipes]|uniref:Uncharacterized protein n=1 Tax=Odynerus spinipes TaxID=1348599 RepID=A0AAD9VUX5_9HYME|nr:hypothetical protein KPH14_010996 [Odynerus spinipes]